jgi:UDP-2-acetamido-2,6-beta-L-arabino-hexul-4-ose reductase
MDLCGKRILVTGSKGFIGKNLVMHLRQQPDISVTTFDRGDDVSSLPKLVSQIDIVIHLAGENRPKDQNAFREANVDLTAALCAAVNGEISSADRKIPLLLASSTQALQDNAYGRSKLAAEELLRTLAHRTGNPCLVFRLPGVFGKWCRPYYNSVVATFCYQIARDIPIQISDTEAGVRLVYVDDVVKSMLTALSTPPAGFSQVDVARGYEVTLGELAEQVYAFKECRSSLLSERVGQGFTRALYATYVSCLPEPKFAYPLQRHADARGVFVEMLKTHDSGQFSYFTAHPGITRGGHYHHTKTEKFLVVKGAALFRFRHIVTDEVVEIRTSSDNPEVVDTIPGWAHDITNVGEDEMIVMLWANENFDRENPDTVASEV